MEQQLDFDEKEQAFLLMRSLDAMRKEKKECDLVIKVGREELAVHRNVMRARSDYIDAMLSHDTLGNQSGVVEMKGVRFEPVKKCVDFFYTGKISTSEEKCEELLYTADLMLIKPVCHKIAQFLQSRLNPKSFFNIKKIATKFVLENLKKVCDGFALEKLNLIVKEDEFDNIDLEYLTHLVVSKKYSSPRGEDSKLAIVLQWIKADFKSRCDHLHLLLKHIDLTKICPGSIKYIAEKETQFHQCAEFMRMLVLAGSDRSGLKLQSLEVDDSSPNAIIVSDHYSQCLQAYYPETNSWTKMQSLQSLRGISAGSYTLGNMENFIYVLMAGRKAYCLNSIEKGSSWVPMKDMLKNHDVCLRSTSHGGFVYVVGNSSMERYCPGRPGEEWEEVDCNGSQCYNCGIVGYNDHIYCIGGYDNVRSLNDVNKFLPSSSTWSAVAPMRIARQIPAVCVYNDKIYVAGGCDGCGLKSVECYYAKTNCWEILASMNSYRSYFGLCAVGTKLYAVGRDHCQEPCSIESYDPESDSWSMVSRQPDMKIMAEVTTALYLPHES